DLSTERRFCGTPLSVGYEKDFYSAEVSDDEDPNFVERAMASLETHFSQVVATIERKHEVPRDFAEWNFLLNLIALQAARVPGTRKNMNHLLSNHILDSIRADLAEPSRYEAVRRAAAAKGHALPPGSEVAAMINAVGAGDIQISLNRNFHLSLISRQ